MKRIESSIVSGTLWHTDKGKLSHGICMAWILFPFICMAGILGAQLWNKVGVENGKQQCQGVPLLLRTRTALSTFSETLHFLLGFNLSTSGWLACSRLHDIWKLASFLAKLDLALDKSCPAVCTLFQASERTCSNDGAKLEVSSRVGGGGRGGERQLNVPRGAQQNSNWWNQQILHGILANPEVERRRGEIIFLPHWFRRNPKQLVKVPYFPAQFDSISIHLFETREETFLNSFSFWGKLWGVAHKTRNKIACHYVRTCFRRLFL